MKEPTTEFGKHMVEKVQLNRKFLETQGWVLKEEYPLSETFVHKNSDDLICTITLYGGFAITELDWCNKTPSKTFTTLNPDLVEGDYFSIVRMLRLPI